MVREANSAWPLIGFGCVAAIALATQPEGTHWAYVAGAGGLLAGAVLGSEIGSSRFRSSSWLRLLPALTVLVVVALLRQSQGGATSGFSPLAMLAVVWTAMVLDRAAVLLITGCSWLIFAVPLIAVGAPDYPASGWRGACLWTLVAYLIGSLVNAAIADQQRQADEAGEMHRAFGAISTVARSVSLGTDARRLVCSAVITSIDATLATVVEPTDAGFAITGAAGIPAGSLDVRSVQPAASLAAFDTGSRVLISDVSQAPGISSEIIEATGIVSVLYEPIMRDGTSVGVLCVGWATPHHMIDAKTSAVIQFLASEAAAAIERADLLARLDGQARSDPLTGLPNRRAWDETMMRAMLESAPFCVAMIDIDHFKRYNDQHGHPAGDRLLRACAAAWRNCLRPGDTLARIGGEEFSVLLPACGLHDAARVLERLRQATPSGATASVGLALHEPGEHSVDLLARADSALYDAKAAGRDRLLTAA